MTSLCLMRDMKHYETRSISCNFSDMAFPEVIPNKKNVISYVLNMMFFVVNFISNSDPMFQEIGVWRCGSMIIPFPQAREDAC